MQPGCHQPSSLDRSESNLSAWPESIIKSEMYELAFVTSYGDRNLEAVTWENEGRRLGRAMSVGGMTARLSVVGLSGLHG